MARLDRVKNLTGLVEWFAASSRLRGLVNLVIVGGTIDPTLTSDRRAVYPLSSNSSQLSGCIHEIDSLCEMLPLRNVDGQGN